MEFFLPTHVRWDVDFGGRVGRPKRIARQIREIAPKFVELRIEGDKGIDELSAIFTEIHKCHPKIEATVGLTARAVAASRWGYPIAFIWGIEGGNTFSRCIPEDARAVSFAPDEETIHLLPQVLEDFAESGAKELHLPNVNAVRALAAVGHIPVASSGQFRELSQKLDPSRISLGGKRIVVYDFFLFRLLRNVFPDEGGKRVEFFGCEAGTRLAYVDWDGNVYPCDSIPIRLGNLLETPFERIWRSPQRMRVVEAIHSVPVDCDSCIAHSGCRGLAYFASKSFDKRESRDSQEVAASSLKTR
ncbi:MAG: SPASM domain-containing protein [Candidatus Deferrimicrobiaceae bacterium]